MGDGRGNEEVELPNVMGLPLDEAKFSLRGSMLNVGQIFYEGVVTDSASAIVIGQFPLPADTIIKVKIGSTINLILSNKPKN